MNEVQPFDFRGNDVRVVIADDEPRFVLADVCRALGLSNPSMVANSLDADALSTAEVTDSLGRRQLARAVDESGLYSVIFQSRKDEARAFQRWVTREVLPSIRRTGSYGSPAAMSFEEMTAHVIAGLSERIAVAEACAKELEAPAGAWNDLSNASGDFTVSDAAKVLGRAGCDTGPRKLYDWMKENGWVFRRGGRWQAMQSAVNAGLIVERITSGYFDQETGERKQADPQVRVTPKGMERLRELLAPPGASLEVVS